jgi:hypothetical protein
LWTRFDPELLYQRATRGLIHLQRFRLAAPAVKRQHELTAQPLAQRLLGDQRLQLADEVAVAPSGQIRIDPILQRRNLQLPQASNRGLRPSLIGEVGQRRTPPQRERLGEQCRRTSWFTSGKRLTSALRELLKARKIDLLGRGPQRIAGSPRHQQRRATQLALFEQSAQLRHVPLQGSTCGGRRALPP